MTRAALSILLGVAVTLAVRGYHFGESNHAVYLIAALRQTDPTLLANDWWTTATLQYHFAFNHLSAALIRWGIIQPAFLVGYLALAVLLHVAWRRIVLRLGGTDGTYLVSVFLYYLLAGGTGLGMYQFLQAGEFLPSNIANVAMLWGLYFWIVGRPCGAGLCLGIAGMFHLNHALAGTGLWFGLTLPEAWRRRKGVAREGEAPAGPRSAAHPPRESRRSGEGKRTLAVSQSDALELGTAEEPLTAARREPRPPIGRLTLSWFLGTIAVLGLSAFAVVPAVRAVLARSGSLPLDQFVDLYVRLRHPHHYDPSSWPWWLWVSFLAPMPLAAAAYRRAVREHPSVELRRAADAFWLLGLVLAAALLGAGAFYVSEPLIQISLYRFSIYPKLLTCVGAAWLLWDRWPRAARFLQGLVLAAAVTASVLLAATHAGDAIAPWDGGPGLLNLWVVWLFLLYVMLMFTSLVRCRPDGKAERWRTWIDAVGSLGVAGSLALGFGLGMLGLHVPGVKGDDPGYLSVCDYARQHTPADAVFLVPPHEQSFRLHARRAIVVNFKNVPQLSAELPEWRDRLQVVLGLEDLRTLPGPFDRTLAAIRDRYHFRPPDDLFAAARRYGARYVVASHDLGVAPDGPVTLKFTDANRQYFLYDLEGR